MKIHKIVLIYSGVILTLSTLFPWMNFDYPGGYISLYEINLVSGLIIFAIGLMTIFIGIYHKPKPGKVYSWIVVLLGSIGYFTISNLVEKIVQYNPFLMGIGIYLSGACILVLEICGLIPTPKENIAKRTTIKWRSIVMVILGLVLTYVLFFSVYKVFVSFELPQFENKTSVEIEETEPTKLTTRQITKTKTPTPDKPQCAHWSDISLNDVGKTKCVYGTVYDSYWGGDTFYIRFTEEKNSFKFIVLNNYFFKDINGKCVQSTGKIKNFENVPYMEVREKLYFCNDY